MRGRRAPAPGLWTSEWTNRDRQSISFFHHYHHTPQSRYPSYSRSGFQLFPPYTRYHPFVIFIFIFLFPPFFFKVFFNLTLYLFLRCGSLTRWLQHFIHMLYPIQCIWPKPLQFSRPPLPAPPLLFISVHSYIFESAAFVMMQTTKFPCNLSVSSHVVLSDPLLPLPPH
jgi:hypothetical protein